MTTKEQKEQAAIEKYYEHWASNPEKEAFRAGAEWAELQMRWISPSERVPLTGEYLVIVTEDNDVYEGFCEVKGRGVWIGPQGVSIDFINRFMPLPAPPAKEGEGK